MVHSIIIVDDEEILLTCTARILKKKFGALIIKSTTDPYQAKSWIDEERPSLLLTDLSMPGLSGLGLIDFALQRWGELPVVLMTASDVAESRLQGRAIHYLSKPFRFQQLESLIESLISSEANVGSAPVGAETPNPPSSAHR